MEWPDSSLVLDPKSKSSSSSKEIKWTLRTESEAYLDGLEAKLKRTKVPNLLPPSTTTATTRNELGLQEDMSDLDFEEDEEEVDEVVGEEEGREEGRREEQEQEEEELIDDALLDDPGLALLWDSPRELPSPQQPTFPPPSGSTSSSLFPPSSPPSAIPVVGSRPPFSADDLLQPPLNSYTSILTASTTTTTPSSYSSSPSPSTSYTRPNRFSSNPNPNPNPNGHPHRDRTLSRSRSRSSFTTISESPSPPGSLTPTSSLNQPQPQPQPPAVRRSVRFNPRTLLRRPSSFGSYSSDRSGELVSSSPIRGFMAWRLGGGPKPTSGGRTSPDGAGGAGSGSNASSSSISSISRNARVQKMPQVQSWTNYYGTFSSSSTEEEDIRGNPLLEEPVPRLSTGRTRVHQRRKSEEDVLFGTGGWWERARSWEWWCWKLGLGEWWESEGGGGMCCGTGWEEDDWGESQQSGRSSRAVGEGRGFF
ncbi:hypothetical protein BDY24DRAFT_377783 [Mrakia frigida]|uniref:uncharacterized protein n=1 Tax=Mrakia frigida TaxID=29902 RepID=UPI003FCC0679